MQDDDSILCRFCCIVLLEYMVAGKFLSDCTSSFSQNDY